VTELGICPKWDQNVTIKKTQNNQRQDVK